MFGAACVYERRESASGLVNIKPDKDVLMSRAIVVVPCYNEARRLNLRLIQEYGRRADSAELLFVNDGSRDETPQLIEQLHRGQSARFHYLHLAQNSGKAEAVRQGLLRVLALGAELVGFWDADLATPLSSIEPFRRVLDAKPQIDLVIGTRMRLLGHAIERRPLRYHLGRLFARTASMALGMRIFDTQCGAKLFRVTPQLEQTCRGRLRPGGFSTSRCSHACSGCAARPVCRRSTARSTSFRSTIGAKWPARRLPRATS